MKLMGKSVLIAGASSGIGADCARVLARRGARCILLARRAERLQALALETKEAGLVEPMVITADLTDPPQVAGAFDAIDRERGGLDVLLYNAGIGQWSALEQTEPAAARRIFELNFWAAAECIRQAIPLLRKSGGGRIVLVSSVAGIRGMPGGTFYSASKFALDGLADALRVELARDGIGVTVVYPSLTRTEFFEHLASGEFPSTKGRRAQTPQAAAEGIVRAIERERRRAVLSTKGRLIVLAHRLAPGLLDWVQARKWR